MNNPTQQPRHSAPDLKIMIISTPKTGNTWLRHLLAAIYDLRTVKLGFPFSPAAGDALGERWIMHQHYKPEPTLLEWAGHNDVVLITTTRHPGDVLLSLYHYVRSYKERFDFYRLAELVEDDGTFGEPVRSIVRTIFWDIIGVSVAWKATGVAHMVEYEALYFDPVDTLTTLTNAILPVSRDCIERAVERCHIREMRALTYENRSFFRQGGYGGWRQVLPHDIIDLLRTTDPYPAQFAALGYTLDAQDRWSNASANHPPSKAGFFEQFGHSPATTSLLKSIYLSFDSSDARRRWPNIAGAGVPTAFHVWLNQPADTDPYAPSARPLITNIAAHIHRLHSDLCAAFPDMYGQDRADFVRWLLDHAEDEYSLEPAAIAPMRQSFNQWAIQPDADDPTAQASGQLDHHSDMPVLTNLAVYIYHRRPDLRAAFPDMYGRHRIDLVRWVVERAVQEYNVDQTCVNPLRQSLNAWAAQPDANDPADQHAGVPRLTNLAAYIYRRPDLRAAFPDAYGRQRIAFLLWLIDHASGEYQLDDICIAPLRRQFLDWALHSQSRRSHQRYDMYRFVYLSRYLLAHKQLAPTPISAALRSASRLLIGQ